MKKIEILLDGKKAEAMEADIAAYVSGCFNKNGWEENAMSVKDISAAGRTIVVPEFLKRKAVET